MPDDLCLRLIQQSTRNKGRFEGSTPDLRPDRRLGISGCKISPYLDIVCRERFGARREGADDFPRARPVENVAERAEGFLTGDGVESADAGLTTQRRNDDVHDVL